MLCKVLAYSLIKHNVVWEAESFKDGNLQSCNLLTYVFRLYSDSMSTAELLHLIFPFSFSFPEMFLHSSPSTPLTLIRVCV